MEVTLLEGKYFSRSLFGSSFSLEGAFFKIHLADFAKPILATLYRSNERVQGFRPHLRQQILLGLP